MRDAFWTVIEESKALTKRRRGSTILSMTKSSSPSSQAFHIHSPTMDTTKKLIIERYHNVRFHVQLKETAAEPLY